VTLVTTVPILVFLGLSVLELGPMYATDVRQTDRPQTKASLNASALWGRRQNNYSHHRAERSGSVYLFGCLSARLLKKVEDRITKFSAHIDDLGES